MHQLIKKGPNCRRRILFEAGGGISSGRTVKAALFGEKLMDFKGKDANQAERRSRFFSIQTPLGALNEISYSEGSKLYQASLINNSNRFERCRAVSGRFDENLNSQSRSGSTNTLKGLNRLKY